MFQINDRVVARIDLIDDLTDHGMGKQLCATRGDILLVREISSSGRTLYVSHENITDRTFRAGADEVVAYAPQGNTCSTPP